MVRIHLCTGLLERDGRVLLVANQYPNQGDLLWNLPGGRQEWNETAAMTVARELREETGLEVRVGMLAYVAESFDHVTHTHVTAFCFTVESDGEPVVPDGDAHVRDCRFVAYEDLPQMLGVRVIREPLIGHLADRAKRFFGYLDAGITIAFADGSMRDGGLDLFDRDQDLVVGQLDERDRHVDGVLLEREEVIERNADPFG